MTTNSKPTHADDSTRTDPRFLIIGAGMSEMSKPSLRDFEMR